MKDIHCYMYGHSSACVVISYLYHASFHHGISNTSNLHNQSSICISVSARSPQVPAGTAPALPPAVEATLSAAQPTDTSPPSIFLSFCVSFSSMSLSQLGSAGRVRHCSSVCQTTFNLKNLLIQTTVKVFASATSSAPAIPFAPALSVATAMTQ